MKDQINPGYWFNVSVLPPELRNLIHLYWDKVFQELGERELPNPQRPMDMEAMMGHSLARVKVRGEEMFRTGEEVKPEEKRAWEVGIRWIDENMRREVLPSDYQRLLSQYRLALNHSQTASWFWRSLPTEIKGAIVELSDFKGTEEFQNSPLLLARALAQTFYRSRNQEWAQLHEKIPDSTTEAVSGWIHNKMEALTAEDLARFDWQLAGEARENFIREFIFQYYQALALESRREIYDNFNALDIELVDALGQEQLELRKQVQTEFKHLNPASRDLLALGYAVGHTLNRLYVGIINYGVDKKIFSVQSLGIHQEALGSWTERTLGPKELALMFEGLSEEPLSVSRYRNFIEMLQKLSLKWRPLHPLTQGMEEAFSVGGRRFSFWERMEQLRSAALMVEHGPALQVRRGMHPEIQAWVNDNTRVLGDEFADNPTQIFARSLAMTLGQSNGIRHPWLHHPIGFHPLAPLGDPAKILLQVPIPAMGPEQGRRYQQWFRNLMVGIQGEKSLLELWSYLNSDLGKISGPTIWNSLDELPPEWVEGLYAHYPWLRFQNSILKDSSPALGHLGRGLGEFMREAYGEIFRLGAQRSWLDPQEFNVWISPRGFFGEEGPDFFLDRPINRPFVMDTLRAHQWLFGHLWRWGGVGHPLYLGFRKSFYQGDFEEANPLHLKIAAQHVEQKLAEEG